MRMRNRNEVNHPCIFALLYLREWTEGKVWLDYHCLSLLCYFNTFWSYFSCDARWTCRWLAGNEPWHGTWLLYPRDSVRCVVYGKVNACSRDVQVYSTREYSSWQLSARPRLLRIQQMCGWRSDSWDLGHIRWNGPQFASQSPWRPFSSFYLLRTF